MGQMKSPRLPLSPKKTDRKNNFKKTHWLKKHLKAKQKTQSGLQSVIAELRDTQSMFFVPSVQKPLVSPPPHSSISPSGVSETVQGLPVLQTKLGLAALRTSGWGLRELGRFGELKSCAG